MTEPAETSKLWRQAQVSAAFTPAAPVNDTELFADRPDQVFDCMDALFQQGLHVALYGERGVGKTSLANVLPKIIRDAQLPTLDAVRVDCNTNDTFNSIWRKIFRALNRRLPPLEDRSHETVDPEEIRFELEELERRTLIVIDEFDRAEDDEALSLLADTVKTLSDHTVGATLMFVGVASSVQSLLGEHESISRNVRQVYMPRMSIEEMQALLTKGFAKIDGLSIQADAERRILNASEGLPHFAHLLGLHSAQRAVTDDRDTVTRPDVEKAELAAFQTHVMHSEYLRATQSPQPDHLFEQVLLACAYAPHTSLGHFRPGDVRAPLSAIVGREMGIQSFQRHLSEFSGTRQTLAKEGEPRHYVYRFRNPFLQPFVKMAARAKGLISDELERSLQDRQAGDSQPTWLAPST